MVGLDLSKGLNFLHETGIRAMMARMINKGLYFMVLFIFFHFGVEACTNFVDVIDTATEHIGVFLPRELEMRKQAVAELQVAEVGITLSNRGDEARMHTLESLLETRPMVFALEKRLLQVLEGHWVAAVTRQHLEAADDVAFLQKLVLQPTVGLFAKGVLPL